MAKQKFGLGRGLDALISGASEVMAAQQAAQQAQAQNPVPLQADAAPQVSIMSIMPNPRQPRRAFREDDPLLLELSASIKEHGLIQPIVVKRLDEPDHGNTPETMSSQRPLTNGGATGWFAEETPPFDASPSASEDGAATEVVQYQIIAGERRWRAARLAGLTKVPVVIKEVTPQQMLELALIENIQRADLNPIEEALAYQALISEFDLTQEMVAKRVGKDRSTVTNSLRLLQLSPKVREALLNQSENFSEGHARTLVGITKEEDQVKAMQQIIALHLNVRQAEELARRIKASQDVAMAIQQITPSPQRSPELKDLESQFRNALMVKVDLKCNEKGKGTLVLHFNTQDELESLYSRLTKQDG